MVAESVWVCEALVALRAGEPSPAVVESVDVALQGEPGSVHLSAAGDWTSELFHY